MPFKLFFHDIKSVLIFGFPIILTMLGNMTLGLVDTFVVGQVSALELSGVAAGQGLFMACVFVGQGVLSGIEPFLAGAFGAKDLRKLRRVMAQGFWLSIFISALATPLFYGLSPYYGLLGGKPEVVRHAIPYLKVISLSFPPVILFSYLQRCLQAQGNSLVIAIVMIVANIVNYYADLAFVQGQFGFSPMGAEGVAWASLLCRGFAFVFLLGSFFLHTRDTSSSYADFLCFDFKLLKKAVWLGIPAAAHMALEVFAFALSTILAARLSAVSLAAHHIVLTVSSYTFMFPLGISMASTVRVGQFIGQGEARRAYLNGWITIFLGVIIALFSATMFILYPNELAGMLSSDREVIQMAAGIFGLCALFQVFDGVQVIGSGALRGAGNTTLSLFANICGHWVVGIPLGIYLCFEVGMGVKGLWMGLATGLMIAATVIMFAWRGRGETLCQRRVLEFKS